MKLCKTPMSRTLVSKILMSRTLMSRTPMTKTMIFGVCVGLLALVPAYGQNQRGNLGIDFGQTSDKFGALSRSSAAVGDVNGLVVVRQGKQKDGSPSIVVGGEVRFPSNTTNHANEFALFGGVMFRFNKSFSAGLRAQVHKLLIPPSTVDNQIFNRNNMELIEFPLVLEYKFGPEKHYFVQAQGAPEFRPRWRSPASGPTPLPDPAFDHAYFVRGSLGYNFGKWYARGTYETRYFKFTPGLGNPSNFYNWNTNMATLGVGLLF